MDVLGSFVPFENRRSNYTNSSVVRNEERDTNKDGSLETRDTSNSVGSKTSFLIDDILFPSSKLKNDPSRQVSFSAHNGRIICLRELNYLSRDPNYATKF